MITDLFQLTEIVKKKLPLFLEEYGITEDSGKKYRCPSPEHSDENPSASIHKDGTFIKCFSCNRAADIFTLNNWFNNAPLSGKDFITDNLLKLADKYGIKYSIVTANEEKISFKYNYFWAHRIVAEYIQKVADEDPTECFRKEINRRKWAEKKSIDLGIGCVHSFKEVKRLLLDNGFSEEFIELSGLNRPDIFNSDNLLFTIYDMYHKPIAFYARDCRFEEKKQAWDSRNKMEISHGKAPTKYNSTSNYQGIYEKSSNPYGINDAKDFHKVILVEGHGCKHNLRLNGVDNVLALGGLSFNEALLKKLETIGVTSIVILLDNDEKGKERLRSIIKQFYGKLNIDFFVLDMGAIYPDVKDPDELIRKHKIEAFKEIPERNALEWLIEDEIIATEDPYSVIHEMSSYIALERSPINRLKIISSVADSTGIDKSVISEEVDQRIAASKDRKGEFALKIIDEAREVISMNPNAIEAAINLINSKLSNSSSHSNEEDMYGANEILKALIALDEQQLSGEVVPVIKTGYSEFDNGIELPVNEAFILVPAAPNCGKTSFFISLAKGMLEHNEDIITIMYTNDDSRNIYFNRFISADAGLPINWIKNPVHYLDDNLKEKRRIAYKKVSEWIVNESLIIKDALNGTSVEYLGNLLKYYRNKYPSKKIVLFCDNFHKLTTEIGYDDKRLKTEYISQIVKGYTNKYDCIIFATVELSKSGMHEKPQNASSVKETGALEYDSNLILFLWNSLNSRRAEKPKQFDGTIMVYEKDTGQYRHKPIKRPLIECLVLKNKLSEYKQTLYFKFFQDIVHFENVPYDDVADIIGEDE